MSKQKIVLNKKFKGLNIEDLSKMDKKDLIEKIIKLQAHNNQLKNLLNKKLNESERRDEELQHVLQEHYELHEQREQPSGETRKEMINATRLAKKRKFDFGNSHKRHVLVKLLYFGWDYHGYATQEDSNDTIEYHLFNALERTCLIESRATSNYHRCGRTDKEVSAFSQVISIDLRSKFPAEEQLTERALSEEIDYCGLLNRILPSNIKCIAWMPLRSKVYSGRFDCIGRTYRYYFPKASLNIEKMRTAGKLLERHADFRNFCKLDVHNGVTNYVRHLQSVQIERCPNQHDDEMGYDMYYLEIKANAFLWHQIRCIMAILLLIGQGKEEAEVINELLDIEKNPCKPQYSPAAGLPLNLFHAEFRANTTRSENFGESNELSGKSENAETDTTSWMYNEENLVNLIKTVQMEWTQHSVKSAMIHNVLHNLEGILKEHFNCAQQIKAQCNGIQENYKPKQYQKLMERKRCESVENRIEHFIKKQRIVLNSDISQDGIQASKANSVEDMES